MKTVERAAFPDQLWEKVQLSRNFEAAIQQINEQLLYWPKYVILKCKQRLVKITQYLIRMRRLRLTRQKKLIPIQKKVEKRERKRETKALIAARLETNIEKELLERLKKGTYGDIYNFPQHAFDKALDEEEVDSEVEDGEENAPEKEMEIEGEEGVGRIQYVAADDFDESDVSDMEDFGGDSDDEDGDSSSDDDAKRPSTFVRKRPRVEIEYESEPSTSARVKRVTTWIPLFYSLSKKKKLIS